MLTINDLDTEALDNLKTTADNLESRANILYSDIILYLKKIQEEEKLEEIEIKDYKNKSASLLNIILEITNQFTTVNPDNENLTSIIVKKAIDNNNYEDLNIWLEVVKENIRELDNIFNQELAPIFTEIIQEF